MGHMEGDVVYCFQNAMFMHIEDSNTSGLVLQVVVLERYVLLIIFILTISVFHFSFPFPLFPNAL